MNYVRSNELNRITDYLNYCGPVFIKNNTEGDNDLQESFNKIKENYKSPKRG